MYAMVKHSSEKLDIALICDVKPGSEIIDMSKRDDRDIGI